MRVRYIDPMSVQVLILKNGMSYAEVSQKLGKNRCYMSKSLKNGCISPRTANKLCEVLNVEFDEVFKIE